MPLNHTEMMHDLAAALDIREPLEIVTLLADGQVTAAASMRESAPSIVTAAARAAECLSGGGRIAYAGAGSSGLMALSDALELPGTFGIPRDRVVILFAGAPDTLSDMKGGAEDDTDLAKRDIAKAGLDSGDCLVAVSASGSTPYTLAALEAACERGATTVAFANNADAPMLLAADVAVHLPTPPEIIAGSTRMGAGTAQKIALNVFSTLTAVHLGHIHDGLMVNVVADNTKLKERAARIVATIGHADVARAADCLDLAKGSVKHAILIAAGARDRSAADGLLRSSGMRLRPALDVLGGGSASGELVR